MRLKRRVKAEPTPLLFTKDATDAKQATFVFLYSRASTLSVPPTNLRQRQGVLDNFAEQYFAHVYAHDNSPHPGAAPNLTDLARKHEAATEDLVKSFFPKVAALDGFDCKSRVVSELQATILKSQNHNLGYVLILAGTYLGAKSSSLGSKTDQILMANLGGGHVPRVYSDLYSFGVDVVRDFQSADGQDMFLSVTAEVKASVEFQTAVTLHAQMVEAAVGLVEAAGLRAIVVELSPSVTACMRDVGLERVAIKFDVHPSGWRGKEHLGRVLRAACARVQVAMYAIVHGCTDEQAATAVDAVQTQNRDDVEAFCNGLGLGAALTEKPASFFHCPLDVIKYTWSRLSAELERVTALFTKNLWLSCDDVDNVLTITTRVRARLGDRFLKAFNSGLKVTLRTDAYPFRAFC